MKPIYLSILTLVLAGVVSYVTTKAVQPTASTSTTTEAKVKKSDESVYDRVMRTGKIRCGYNYYEPGFMKNEKTGEFYGLYYDLLEEMGRISDLEIEWEAIVGWGDIRQALTSNKIDAFCISVWPNALRAKAMLLSDPFLYVNVEAYARTDDKRFDSENMKRINNEDVTISVLDQDIADEIASFDFPKAKKVSVSQLGTDSDLFEQLKYKKADVTFSLHSAFLGFDRENPNILKRIAPSKPLRTYGNTIAIPSGEHDLKFLLDTAIEQMQNSGTVHHILEKYSTEYPDTFHHVAKPYKELK